MKRLKNLLTILLLSAFAIPALAQNANVTYTNEDQWGIYESFIEHFLAPTQGIYKSDTNQPSADHRGNGARDNDFSGCAAAIWCQAIYVDMAVNAYKRALNDKSLTQEQVDNYKKRAYTLISKEKAHYQNFNFDNANTNNGWFVYDDIMWWTVALARAYEAMPEQKLTRYDYLYWSEKSFCRVWYGSKTVGDDGSYADPATTDRGGNPMTGGMFWEWQPIAKANPHYDTDFKSACINFPTVIACATLYGLVPADREEQTAEYPTCQTKAFYLEKAIEIYEWARKWLVSPDGGVYDGLHGYNNIDKNVNNIHLYNQGTYLGAACMLYKITGEEKYLNDAKQAVKYAKEKMCTSYRGKPILKIETGYEQRIYHAIFAQYISMFINDLGQGDYEDCYRWVTDFMQVGWEKRDTSRNLQDNAFNTTPKSDAYIESYGASALPAFMLLFPVKPLVVTGDANGDGAVTVADLTMIASCILGGQSDLDKDAADANGDGNITVADLTMVAGIILGGK